MTGEFSMLSDGITYLKFLLPGIFYAIPCHPLGETWLPRNSQLPYILLKFITWKIAVSGTWLPKKFGCITYSKVGLSRILIGNPMALRIRKFRVHSDFVSMPSFWARWHQFQGAQGSPTHVLCRESSKKLDTQIFMVRIWNPLLDLYKSQIL